MYGAGAIATLNWARLSHPPYSPDLAPSDFHFFNAFKRFSGECTLTSQKKLKITAK